MENNAEDFKLSLELTRYRIITHGLAFLFFLLVLSNIRLHGQEKGSVIIRNYISQDYKAHVQNWATIQDNQGIIYFANSNGILKYNGTDWELIRVSNGTLARSFAKDESGRIYVGAVGEFGYIQTNQNGETSFVSLTNKIKKEDKKFLDVWFTQIVNDDVYFVTYHILFRLRDGQIKSWKTNNNITKCFSVNNQVYINEDLKGIKKVTENELEEVPFGSFFKDKSFRLVFPYEKNKVLIATNRHGFFTFDFDAISTNSQDLIIKRFRTDVDDILMKSRPYNGVRLKDGSFAFGLIPYGAMIVSREGKLKYFFNKDEGLVNDGVTNVFEDSENNLWLTQINGISKIVINKSLLHFGTKDGLKDVVVDVIKFKESMYIGCFSGLYRLIDNKVSKIDGIDTPIFHFLDFNIPNETNGKLLLVATNYNGVIGIRDNKTFTALPSNSIVFRLLQSRVNPSLIYIGKSGSLDVARYENNSLKYIGSIEGINQEVRSLAEESDGTIWATDQNSKVFCIIPSEDILKPKQIKIYTKEHGVKESPMVYNFNDKFTLASFSGLYRFNKLENKFVSDTTFGKDFSDGTIKIVSFKDGKNGDAFISGYKNNHLGLGLKMNGKYEWFESPFLTLPENITTSTYFEADTAVWLNTPQGLYRFKGDLTKHCPPFKTNISKAIIGKDSVVYGKPEKQIKRDTIEQTSLLNSKFEYKYNSITFFYSALSFYNESFNLYQTYLEGLDSDWSNWSKDTKKEYTYLPEGSYIFHVRSKNMYGEMGGETNYTFTILPPWYKTIWAFAIYLLALIAIVWTIIELNLQRLKAANYHLEKTVQERTIDLSETNAQLEEHQAELEVRQEEITAQAELLANTIKELEKLSIVASETDNAVMIMDADTNFEWVNAGFIRMYKNDLNELKKERGESLLKASQADNIHEIVKECLKQKTTVNYQSYNTLKTGENIWVQTTLTPILSSTGDIIKIIAIDSDITKLKQAEFDIISMNQQIIAQNSELEKHRSNLEDIVHERTAELEIAKNKAEESDRLKSAFLANMSHEIRTPMNAIIGFSTLLSSEHLDSSEKEELTQHIISNSDTLLHLINEIIDLSKIEAGQLSISIKPCNLNRLLNEIFESYRAKESKDSNNEVELRFTPAIESPDFTIQTDALRLKQIISNLVDNALKFTEHGFVEFGYLLESNTKIKFFVKDTGIGISEGLQDFIFNRFTKIEEDKSKLYRGAGLGLSICKSLTTLLGGEIFVESEPNKGTSFYVTLPLIKGTERDETPFSNERFDFNYEWVDKSILIAEDEESNFQYLVMLLRSTKVTILRAKNGRDAIELLAKNNPDLILMDIKMPIMDGVEATQIIRQKNKTIPIVALSAYAFNQEIEEIRKEGFNEYLVKPTSPSKLLSLINNFFSH